MFRMHACNSGRIAHLTAPLLLTAGMLAGCSGSGYGGGNSVPTVAIAVQPSTIAVGQAATLTWSSTNAVACTASGGWTGARPSSGAQAVTPAATGTDGFTLTCDGMSGNGQVSTTAVLTVTAQSPFSNTSLVSDTAGGTAGTTDSNLLNAWGIAAGPATPIWVANNRTQTSTIYDGNGKPQPADTPLVVNLPADAGGATFDLTGIVFNGTNDFVVTKGEQSGPPRFLFDGEGGMIAGWSPAVDVHHAVTMYVDQGNAVYKGLAIASDGTGNFLYATDFHNGKVDVFNATFQKQPVIADRFAFLDPDLPAGYAPFGIQAIATGTGGARQLYVSYAKQQGPDNFDSANGAGLGLVDVFDTSGRFVKRLVPPGGRLNAPWGMALAPADFGTLGNSLLVGNFGDGRINGYDPATGAFMGTIANAEGVSFALPGLWGIAFGNGAANQPRKTLFYAAGTNEEANGAFGRMDLGATPPILNAPPVVAVTAPAGNVSGTLTLTAAATADVAIANVEFFVNGTETLGFATTAPYTVQWDTTHTANGAVQVTATATDVDGNVGTSPPVTVTVVNGAAGAPNN